MDKALSKKLLFAIMPKGFWLFLFLAIWLRIGDEGLIKLSNLILNILLSIVGLKAAILIHESGHILFGKLAGATPRRMVLGKGHEIIRKDIKGVKVIVNSNINSGAALSGFDKTNNIKARLLLYYSGGFIANFLAWLLLIFLFGFNFNPFDGVHPASVFAYMNLVMGIIALIPYKVPYEGIKLVSDGLAILKIPSHSQENINELKLINELLDAYDLYEAKAFQKAIGLYENCLKLNPGLKNININLSAAYLKIGEFEKSRLLLVELLPIIEEKGINRYEGIIYNLLAWVNLVLGDFENAGHYSTLACKLDPKNENFRGTRGAVLIERGEYKAGRELLLPDFNFNFINNHTLTSAIYLSMAFHALNEQREATKFRSFVDENFQKLDLDERLLYSRVLSKIKDTSLEVSSLAN